MAVKSTEDARREGQVATRAGQFGPGNQAAKGSGRGGKRKRRASADEKLALAELRRLLKDPNAGDTAKQKAAELLLGYERGKPVSAAAMGTVEPEAGPPPLGLIILPAEQDADGIMAKLQRMEQAAMQKRARLSPDELATLMALEAKMDAEPEPTPAQAPIVEPAQAQAQPAPSTPEREIVRPPRSPATPLGELEWSEARNLIQFPPGGRR